MNRMRGGGPHVVTLVLWCASFGAAGAAAGQTHAGHGVWTGVSVQGRMRAGSPWRWASESLVRGRDGASILHVLGEQVVVSRDERASCPRSHPSIGPMRVRSRSTSHLTAAAVTRSGPSCSAQLPCEAMHPFVVLAAT